MSHHRAMHLRLTLDDGDRTRLARVETGSGTLSWGELSRLLNCRGWSVAQPGMATAELLADDCVVGQPPLLDGATIRRCRPAQATAPTMAPVEVIVSEGPDVGHTLHLPVGGTLRVGRSTVNDLVLDDPSLSRHHATLRTTRRGVMLAPLRATNPAWLDGEPVGQDTPWQPGHRVRLGGTTLELVGTTRPLQGQPDGEGGLLVRSSTVTYATIPEQRLTTPTPPDTGEAPRMPVLSWLIPLVASSALALVLRMPTLLMFGLLAPAISLGSYLSDRRASRRRNAQVGEHHADRVHRTQERTRRLASAELDLRRARSPDLARLLRRSVDQWWDQAGLPLLVRVGSGTVDLAVTLDDDTLTAADGPVTLCLDDGLEIVGDAVRVRGIARSLILQILCRHPPNDVGVRVEAPEERVRDWDWLGWTPHAATGSPSRVLTIADRLDGIAADLTTGSEGAGPRLVLSGVPAEGTTGRTLLVPPSGPGQLRLDVERPSTLVRPDQVSIAFAQASAARLAPMRVLAPSTERQLPRDAALRDLLGHSGDTATLRAAWLATPASTRCVIGVDADGPAHLDLRTDGPHMLVGGTTGAGKSELLRTLIASLAAVNRPDELVFVLVDYKGGAAFAEAAHLPHTVGMVTDLDTHEADRALSSLTAELHRRERLLAAAGASDLHDYRARGPDHRLARLVVVIDEFGVMAKELPELLDGLVRLAAQGRSLGVHLVLATQRPAGVVSAEMRANVNLRIALRMREASDSMDVVDCADAAGLPHDIPGRALVRTGTAPARAVQVARVDTLPASAPRPTTVTWLDSPWEAPVEPAAPPAAQACQVQEESLLLRLAAAAQQVCTELGITAPPSPWLPPLPHLLTWTELCARHLPGVGMARRRPLEKPPFVARFALIDRPRRLSQEVHVWQPLEDGHLAFVGAPRSGRSTSVRTIVGDMLSRHEPGDLHLAVLDADGSLAPLDEAPHTIARAGMDDRARLVRLVAHLMELVRTRQRGLVACASGSLAEQRASAEAAGAAPWSLVVLVVDGWPQIEQALLEHERGRALDGLLQVLRDGPAVGVVAMLTGDRSLLVGRLAALISTTWFSRTADPTDLMLVGLTRRQIPASMPPGRLVRASDGLVAQAATLGADGSVVSQLAALTELCRGDTESASEDPVASGVLLAGLPSRLVPLPAVVHWADLRVRRTTDHGPGLELGLGGDDGAVVGLPVDPVTGGLAVVAGPPRSGRSNALRCLSSSAQDVGWSVLWVPGAGAPTGSAAGDQGRRALTDLLPRTREARRGTVVLVDDLSLLVGSPDEDVLMDWASATSTDGGVLVASGEPTAFAASYRGLAPLLVRGRVGILLRPEQPSDGQCLGVSAATGDLPLPGRGVLVDRGRQLPVQVALASGHLALASGQVAS